jgi:hypothetical protein
MPKQDVEFVIDEAGQRAVALVADQLAEFSFRGCELRVIAGHQRLILELIESGIQVLLRNDGSLLAFGVRVLGNILQVIVEGSVLRGVVE